MFAAEQGKAKGFDSCDRPNNLTQIGFSLCDLEIWWMTSKNNRAPLLYYVKLVHHFKSIGELKLELQSKNAKLASKSAISPPVIL